MFGLSGRDAQSSGRVHCVRALSRRNVRPPVWLGRMSCLQSRLVLGMGLRPRRGVWRARILPTTGIDESVAVGADHGADHGDSCNAIRYDGSQRFASPELAIIAAEPVATTNDGRHGRTKPTTADDDEYDEPSNNEPSNDEPSNDKPSNDEPSNDEPSNDDPSNNTRTDRRADFGDKIYGITVRSNSTTTNQTAHYYVVSHHHDRTELESIPENLFSGLARVFGRIADHAAGLLHTIVQEEERTAQGGVDRSKVTTSRQ
jgi:hypothetical protein